MKTLLSLLLALLAAGAPSAVSAQQPADTAAVSVRAAIDAVFTGIRTGDSTIIRRVYHPAVRLMSASVRNGAPVLAEDSIPAFMRAVAQPRDVVWDERIRDVRIQVDGPLAVAWMDYEFWVGDRFSHCGVNALQLFRGADGWKVFQIADTRRREGCRPAS